VGLFNALNDHADIHLTVAYFSKQEQRRKWTQSVAPNFDEVSFEPRVIGLDYERNLNVPKVQRFARVLSDVNPDVVICAPDLHGLLTAWFRGRRKFHIVSWLECTRVTEAHRSRLKKKLRKRFFRYPEAYIVPGRATIEYLNAEGALNGARIYMAPNTIDDHPLTIDVDQLRAKFTRLDPVRFLFSGSLIERKGFDILIAACRRLAEMRPARRFTADVLGAGHLQDRSCPQIRYRGFVEGDQYADSFKQSHVFVLPSRRDCNPLTVIEALKSGNVLVVSDGVGNAEEFVRGNGFVVRRGDLESLTATLRHVLELNPAAFLEMAEKSMSLGSRVTHVHSARVFAQCIRDLCGRPSLSAEAVTEYGPANRGKNPVPCFVSEEHLHACHE
jgi:glycosyltransferase involved in cell wall biosynthesis